MIQKIITIVLIIVAAIGMWLIIRRQRRTDCSKGCDGCPLVSGCNRAVIVLCSLMLIPLSLSAHLHGVVLDDKGEPLVGANVWWAGTSVGTTTDAEGLFEIEPIRKTKLLVTSFLGYRNDTTRVKDRSTLMIVLIPDNQQLDEVTIDARRQAVVRSRFSAFDVESFGQAELCKAACCNLSGSFETSASVDVSYADAATGAKQIRLLGLSGMYVQLLTENTPAVRGLAQSFGMEYIPGAWMDAVQISKGTSSVINGYEAITGQINVEYLKPHSQQPIAVNLMINKELHAEANITGGWNIPIPNDPMLGSLATSVLAHYHDGSWPMDGNKDGMLDMPTDRILNLLNRWRYKNDNYTFMFLVRGLHDERHGGQRETVMGKRMGIMPPANPYLIDLRTDRIDGYMKNGIVFDEETGMSLGIIAAGSYHDQHNVYGPRDWTASQANGYLNAIFQNTWAGEHHHHHHDGAEDEEHAHGHEHELTHKLSAGLSVNYDRYWETQTNTFDLVRLRNNPVTGMINDISHHELTMGVFAEYTLTFSDQLTLIAGLRTDMSFLYGPFITPRVNIRYAPFEWWTLRASAGMGYRTPNLIADNAAYLPTARVWDVNNVQHTMLFGAVILQPQQERGVNTGISSVWDIPVGSHNLQLSAEYYYTRFLSGPLVDLDASPQKVYIFNMTTVPGAQSFSQTAQIEASMEILRGWTMTAAFRYNDVRQTTYNPQKEIYELREKVLQNRFKGIISTSYQTPLKKWQFDLTAQFNGPGRVPDGLTLGDRKQYYMHDGNTYHRWYPQLLGQVTKYWRTCSLYLGAENMTNFMQDRPIFGNYDAQGRVDMTADYDASMTWAPTTGWKVYIGFRWALDRPDNQ